MAMNSNDFHVLYNDVVFCLVSSLECSFRNDFLRKRRLLRVKNIITCLLYKRITKHQSVVASYTSTIDLKLEGKVNQ